MAVWTVVFQTDLFTGYDSEAEALSSYGCAATEKDTIKIMRFIACVLCFRKKLTAFNQGQELPAPLAAFFKVLLEDGFLKCNLDTLAAYTTALTKAMQINESRAPKPSEKEMTDNLSEKVIHAMHHGRQATTLSLGVFFSIVGGATTLFCVV